MKSLPPSAEFFFIQPFSLTGDVWTILLNEPGAFLQGLDTLPDAWDGWERLRGEGSLQSSGDQLQDGRVDWLVALGSARNYPLARCVNVEIETNSRTVTIKDWPETPVPSIERTARRRLELKGCEFNLFVNDFCVFFLVFRATVRIADGPDPTSRPPTYAEASSALRGYFEDTRPDSWMALARGMALGEVERLVARLLPGRGRALANATVLANTGHMLQLYYTPFGGDPGDIHASEEAASQRSEQPAFVESHPGGRAHFGYSDSSMVDIPATRALACLPFCCFLQGSWYLIHFFRRDLIEIMPRFSSNAHRRPLGRLAVEFDLFVLSFERFSLSHSRFMGSLRPWQYEAARRLEASWLIPGDLQLLKETLETIRGFVERRFRGAEEASGRKQEQALNLIALLQIFTIISVTADYLSLVGSHHAWIHWAALSSTVLFLSLAIRSTSRNDKRY